MTETDNMAQEMYSFMRSNIGRNSSENEVRTYFEDGVLDLWLDDNAEYYVEDAFEAALDMYMTAQNESVMKQAWRV